MSVATTVWWVFLVLWIACFIPVLISLLNRMPASGILLGGMIVGSLGMCVTAFGFGA